MNQGHRDPSTSPPRPGSIARRTFLAGITGTSLVLTSGAFSGGRAQAALDLPASAGALGHHATPMAVNEILNPSFEVVENGMPANWSVLSPATATQVQSSTDRYQSGAYSVRIDDPSATTAQGVRSADVPVDVGVTYEGSVYSFNTQGASNLWLEFWDANGQRINYVTVANKVTMTWRQTTVSLAAPEGAASATLLLYVGGANVGTSYFDDASLIALPRAVAVWGIAYLTHGQDGDTLTVRVAADTLPIAIDHVGAFGATLVFENETQMTGSGGETALWESNGGFQWDGAKKRVTLEPGQVGSLTISDISFDPPDGWSFSEITLHEAMDDFEHGVWVAVGGYSSPDHDAEQGVALAALSAAERASDYLESLRQDNGGINITHREWPTEPHTDEPQGNLLTASGNLRLWQVTGDATYRDRAIESLNFLVGIQKDSGGFGLPWAWGGANADIEGEGDGHFSNPGHYPENGVNHPVGTEYAIYALVGLAESLLEGYLEFNDQSYLDAVNKAKEYLLYDANGFQWLDQAQTIGSIPYCTMDPVFADREEGSTEIYNVDGSTLAFFSELYAVTGEPALLTYGDAIARNLAQSIEADGSLMYGWYESPKSPGYNSFVYGGLLRWGVLRNNDQWVGRAREGVIWMTNITPHNSFLLWEFNAEHLGGLDNTQDVIGQLNNLITTQRPPDPGDEHAGSWSGGSHTRTDASNLHTIAGLLKQMGYHS